MCLFESLQKLQEMAKLLSLVDLQKKGNKKSATKAELARARKQAVAIKRPAEARNQAQEAYLHMKKREIIQVFLDREAELRNPISPVPKPLFMDKKIVQWAKLDAKDKESAAIWLASAKTERQLEDVIKKAEIALKQKITPNNKARIPVYKKALRIWQDGHKLWKMRAKQTDLSRIY